MQGAGFNQAQNITASPVQKAQLSVCDRYPMSAAETERLASFPIVNPNPVLELSRGGELIFCNPAARRFENTDREGGSVNPFIPADLPGIVGELQGGTVTTLLYEVEIDGVVFEETICLVPQYDSLRIYALDVTDRKRMERQIEALNRKLAARVKELEETNLELESGIGERLQAEEGLRRLNDELETRVELRTRELALTIASLQEEIGARATAEYGLRHSEEILQLAVEITGLGTYDFHPRTGKLFVSGIAREHYGLPAGASYDYPAWLACLHPEDREETDRRVHDALVLASGGTYRNEYRTVGGGRGEIRFVSSRGQVFFDEAGRAVRLIGVTRDVTGKRKSEETIRRLNRLHVVLSATNRAIVHTNNRDDLFREFCRVAVELGGFRLAWVGLVEPETGTLCVAAASGATGYLDGIRVSVGDNEEGMGPIGISVRHGAHYISNDFAYSDGTRPWHDRARAFGLYACASIALRQGEEVVGALSLYAGERDFFDARQVDLLLQMGAEVSFALDKFHQAELRRRAERSLQQESAERLRALEELSRQERMLIHQSRQAALGEMIGNIAHQWRQPLNVLGILVQQLRIFSRLGEADREFIDGNTEKSMELIQHMSVTIEDFRNFFKPEKEKVAFKVREVVAKTLSLLEGSFCGQEIGVVVDVEGEPVILGYPNEFSQALLNILINARDALSERGVDRPKLSIAVGTKDDRAVVTIADNAGGIPEEILDRIFDPYFTTKGPQQGTGVGLFMSKTIIEKNMGGSLSACNHEGGALFRIVA